MTILPDKDITIKRLCSIRCTSLSAVNSSGLLKIFRNYSNYMIIWFFCQEILFYCNLPKVCYNM